MGVSKNIIGKYVFSQEKKGSNVLTAWEIKDIFESSGDYLLIQNVITNERKCCFTFYSLRVWDSADFINYSIKEVIDGLAEVQDLNEVLCYDNEDLYCYYGWLTPEGRFYHCQCACHDKIARIVFQMSEAMCENRGWVKVLNDDFLMGRRWLTLEQAHWLKQHGFDEEDVDDHCNF